MPVALGVPKGLMSVYTDTRILIFEVTLSVNSGLKKSFLSSKVSLPQKKVKNFAKKFRFFHQKQRKKGKKKMLKIQKAPILKLKCLYNFAASGGVGGGGGGSGGKRPSKIKKLKIKRSFFSSVGIGGGTFKFESVFRDQR